jgi:hypothetical protein
VPDRHRSLGSVYYDASKDRWVASVYVRDPDSNRSRTARRFFRTKGPREGPASPSRKAQARRRNRWSRPHEPLPAGSF